MPGREWFHPQRQLQLAVTVLAGVSAAGLAWLAWLLVQQDAALERQRQADRLQQAADTASAALRVSIADLPALAAQVTSLQGVASGGPSAARPAGGEASATLQAQGTASLLLHVDLLPSGVSLPPASRVLFVPGPGDTSSGARSLGSREASRFDLIETLEFRGDLAGALAAYQRLAAAHTSTVTTATAIARIARVQRKLGRLDAALVTYDHLDTMDATSVDRLPAGLIARIGRASVFEAQRDSGRLKDEAAHLRDDLLSGRWTLTRAEFEYYSRQVESWAGTPVTPRVEDMVASEAVEWAWEELRTTGEPGWRAVRLPAGAAVVAWSPAGDRVRAVVADGRYLSHVAGTALPNLPWVVRDARGDPLAGDPRAATVAIAASARVLGDASGGEWTLHLGTFEPPASAAPRRPLLLSTVALAGLVLAAGWYFVLRGMARERMAGRAQSDFVAAVSHEFRSPLTSMSHVAEMLADGRVPEESRARAYDVLVRDTDRLRALVEQLLEFGRFEAGTFELRVDRLDLADTVHHTVADFQARVARDGCRVEVTVPDEPVWIDADREALGLALWNLLDNAVKYSPGAPAVWVALRQDGEQVQIDVRDEGIGIPADEQVEVFRQFVRGAEAKSRRIRGTGVGLALVRHVARAHGGDVTVDSAPGRGSTFTMSLPERNVDHTATHGATKEDVA